MLAISVFVAMLLAQEPAGARSSAARCEALLQESVPAALRSLNAAACFDDEWQFQRAKELLTEAVTLLQAEAAAGKEPPLPGTAKAFAGAFVEVPQRTNNPPAPFPSALVLKGVKGVVVTEIVVDRDGRVRGVRIVESVPELDGFARELVRNFRFAPTRVSGVPTDIAMFLPVRYGLASEPTPGDRARLAAIYYREQRIAVASQAAAVALYHVNRDVARYGGDTNPQGLSASQSAATSPTASLTPPKQIKRVEPVYPEYAIKAGVTGRVVVTALVDVNGIVGRARVTKGIHGLDAAALDAVIQWQYAPGTVDGKKVPTHLTVDLNFGTKR